MTTFRDTAIRRALIAVYDKTGIAEFARTLVDEFGVEILSTGGTARHLKEAGIPVTMVEDVTGFPEMLGGRVKTLHPKIHAAILADRDNPEHMGQLAAHGIDPIDMVVVNLYPFEDTVAKPDCTFEDAIEMIDIGGPCMLRAAAKNHGHVLPVHDPQEYPTILKLLRAAGGITERFRRERAGWVFNQTRAYDTEVSAYFWRLFDVGRSPANARRTTGLPKSLTACFEEKAELRYGENPHQSAGLYDADDLRDKSNLPTRTSLRLLHVAPQAGEALSYNNYVDADAALALCAELNRELATAIDEPRASARAVAQQPTGSNTPSPFAPPEPSAPAWLLTWTTYGTWLPGDGRGYVSRSPRESGDHALRNQPATDYDAAQGDIESAARERQSGDPILLTQEQAVWVSISLADAATRHNIALNALSIMPDHVHLLCQSDCDGSELLQLFKGNSAHALSQRFPLKESQRWWTKSGSKRYIRKGDDPFAAVDYVCDRRNALVVRCFDASRDALPTDDRTTARAEARGSSMRPSPPAIAVFIKHTNACGVGIADEPVEAYRRAYLGDPNAAMGGILAVNFPVDAAFALTIMGTLQQFKDDAVRGGCKNPPQAFFAEVIIAPRFEDDAVDIIRTAKKWGERVRLLAVGDVDAPPSPDPLDYKRITGGLLIQTPDLLGLNEDQWKVVTHRPPTDSEVADLRLAWLICKHTKSNAISICRDGMLIGNGAGQMSRVMSCRIATWLAKENGHEAKLQGSVAASDAFFPFRDGPDILADAGVTAIIQPGGSKRDDEVIAAANERNIAMIFTGTRHFKH